MVLGTSIPKSDEQDNYNIQNWTDGLSGNDYRVAALPKSYLIIIGIIMQSLKSIAILI